MDQQQIDALHQQASSLYLQGNLAQAIETWQKLLEASPQDARALEGIRLCESMLGSESETISDGSSPFAVGTSAPPTEPAPPLDSGDGASLKDTLDNLLDLGTPSAMPPPAPAGPPPSGPSTSFGTAGLAGAGAEIEDMKAEDLVAPAALWKFGEGDDEAPALPDPPAEPALTEPPMPTEVPPLDTAPPEAASPEPPEDDSAAGAELRRRVGELLSTALKQMEEGTNDEALRTLDRLLILDEENETALSLRDKIQGATPAAESAADAPVGDGPPPGPSLFGTVDPAEIRAPEGEAASGGPAAFDELSLDDEGETLALNDDATTDPEPAPEPPLGVEPGLADDLGLPLEAEAPIAPDVPAATPRVLGLGRFQVPMPSRRVLMAGGGVLVLLVGWLGWSTFFGGGEEIDPGNEPVRRVERPTGGNQDPTEEPDPTGPDAATVPSDALALEAALGRAEAALAGADYAAAILAFGEALELDPENEALSQRLEDTADRYRIQQKEQARWAKARSDFEAGNYEEALSFYYRLPAEHQTEVVDRYKANGWYNLAIVALRGRNCDAAASHLKEASELRPSDPQLLAVQAVSRTCSSARRNEYDAAVASLSLRAIDD